MEKDIDAMNDRELLVELADRVIDWFDKLMDIGAWDNADADPVAHIEEDEAFCLVREIVRKVKNDKYLWQC